MPNTHEFKKKYKLGFLGEHLFAPQLWSFHRIDIARAFALGVFVGFLPVPGHTIIIPLIAIFLWHANLPVALAVCWFNNPATMVPIYYFNYQLGMWILGWPSGDKFHIEWSLKWFNKEFVNIWEPLILGSLVLAIIGSVSIYWLILLIWRVATVYKWKNRKKGN